MSICILLWSFKQYNLEQGLNICDYTDIVMNVTPLLIAICKDPKFVDQTTETLASHFLKCSETRNKLHLLVMSALLVD